MSDNREAMLVRLQACIATLAPGVTFTLPGGVTHRPIETDLGGRVYAKARPETAFDSSELPCVEILTSSTTPDTIREVADDDFYLADLKLQLWGFVKSDDAGDGKDAPVRAKLNALRADLITAVEAFPYWTSTEYPDPIGRLVGRVDTILEGQWTEPATNSPDAYLVLDYALRYAFNRFDA